MKWSKEHPDWYASTTHQQHPDWYERKVADIREGKEVLFCEDAVSPPGIELPVYQSL
jgi:hypothetical protein